VIFDVQKKKIFENALHTGIKTNNQAEYSSLLYALHTCFQLNVRKLKVFGDSQLIINQVSYKFKVRKKPLMQYWMAIEEFKPFF